MPVPGSAAATPYFERMKVSSRSHPSQGVPCACWVTPCINQHYLSRNAGEIRRIRRKLETESESRHGRNRRGFGSTQP